jgi:hypothetical protein
VLAAGRWLAVYEAASAYWAVFAAVAASGDVARGYALCYVAAATTVAVNLAEARECVRPGCQEVR